MSLLGEMFPNTDNQSFPLDVLAVGQIPVTEEEESFSFLHTDSWLLMNTYVL